MKRITFDEAHYSAGADVIVDAGTVVYLGNQVFMVPEATIAELKKRNVSFMEVNGLNGEVPSQPLKSR